MATERPHRRPTITDVAARAGVATSTVSRALSRPERVNVHTREHVLAVVEELGYVPNPAARALESGRTRTIALLVPDITNPYFAGVIKGAERAAAAAGLTLVLGDTQESAATEEQLVRRLGRSVDGFVLSATRLPDDDLRRAAEAGPVVLVNRAARGLPCVVADYDSGTRQIVDHLASLAHESFVFAGGPAESWSGHRRWLQWDLLRWMRPWCGRCVYQRQLVNSRKRSSQSVSESVGDIHAKHHWGNRCYHG